MLQSVFNQLVSVYPDNSGRSDQLWEEITRAYQSKGRYYHTLAHLENLYQQLLTMQSAIHDWHTLLFTMFYHDFVYNPVRSDNEAKSAEVAVDRMKLIGVPDAQIALCRLQIEATKAHALSPVADTNYFTDADLSVLGQDAQTYRTYCAQVRKEYSVFPDLIYKPSRRKVLNHFLAMPRIYKTDFAYERWEQPARINLANELHSL